VLLNTAFSGPQLIDLLGREHVDVLIYDQEYAGALSELPDGPVHVVAWEDEPTTGLTLDRLIADHLGQRAPAPTSSPHVVLLTSGTTGAPKGAKRGTGGGAGDLVAIIERVPWRAEDTVVVAAPMFHAWGFGCLVLAATMANTIVMRRHFDPEQTLAMAARHRAEGMAVVPVMLERIVALPEEVKRRYPLPALRVGDGADRADRVHGRLRRRGLQQLQRHRGRDDRHRDPGGPPGRPAVGGPAGARLRAPDPG
jgi:fatty-acyl-CoA synthase